MISNCEAAGNGDSGIYPGAGADTTDHRYTKFYPTYRFSQVVENCDSHHNTGGFSGTDSHGTLITHNNFYDNSLGFTTDVFTAPGHPGFPQHGNVIRDNKLLRQQLQPLPAGQRRRAVHRLAGGHRAVAGRRQRQRRGGQLLLRQLAPRPRCSSRSPTPRCAVRRRSARRRPSRVATRPRCPRRTTTRSRATPSGRRRRARRRAQRPGHVVGLLPRQHRQLLLRQQGGAGQDGHDRARSCCRTAPAAPSPS